MIFFSLTVSLQSSLLTAFTFCTGGFVSAVAKHTDIVHSGHPMKPHLVLTWFEFRFSAQYLTVKALKTEEYYLCEKLIKLIKIRKNEEPDKDLTVAADSSSIITPSSLLMMIFFTSCWVLQHSAILLPHLSFADDEERVSGGALTNNVIRVAIMSLKGGESRGEMWTIWYDASDHRAIFLIVHMDEQMEGSDLERKPGLIMEEVLRKMSPPPKHLLVCWGRPRVAAGKRERWEERGHSEQDKWPFRACGGREHALYLRRKSMYWECLMTPLLIMMVWKFCRSMAHSLMSVSAGRHAGQSRSEQKTQIFTANGANLWNHASF